MIADLHIHYPMRVIMGDPRATLDRMRQVRERPLRDKLRALILRIASRHLSDRDPWSGARTSVPLMQEGGVGLAFSVLYAPFEEIDVSVPYGSAPSSAYFAELESHIRQVQEALDGWDDSVARLVKGASELDAAIADGAIAFVHCVEGGFHLGDSVDEIDRNVHELAELGVAYITLAHLFWRQVATNTPALPFLSDRWYDALFSQPDGEGLTERGRAAVEAMVRERILVDVSHMRADALRETLDLLDALDPDMPVVASHAGYRFGDQSYMLDRDSVERIAARRGVIGLIMAQHQLNDGIRDDETETLDESLDVIRRHIDRISEITGSAEHVAIGSDLDGFIKPTMGGIERASDFASLEARLREAYPDEGELIASGNAVRVLKDLWSPGQ